MVSDSFGTAGIGMRSRRAAPRSAPPPPQVLPTASPMKLLAGLAEPRRHRGMAARRPTGDAVQKPKPYSLLMPLDMADWVGDFAHFGRVDRSEIHRELVHVLMDCQDGLITDLPSGDGFADYLLDRIMERRRIANDAAATAQATDR